MVVFVLCRPFECGLFEGRGAKKKQYKTNRCIGFESSVGKEPMVSNGDTQGRNDDKERKQNNF